MVFLFCLSFFLSNRKKIKIKIKMKVKVKIKKNKNKNNKNKNKNKRFVIYSNGACDYFVKVT